MKDKKFMSVSEAADYFGVSKPTMYRYLQDKTIPAIKLGEKTWKIPVKYLEAIEAESKK